MPLTLEALDSIVGRKVDRINAGALIEAVAVYPDAGFDRPHRLAQLVPQVVHESGGFRYVEEIWGPTRAQRGYEGRADLGNTEPGDGFLFRGFGLIQNTGRANATVFRDWCWENSLPAPDFAVHPHKQAEPPWSGLVAVWYWMSRGLNRLADTGDVENITRKINGGLNGYADRLKWHWRTSLVLLGYKPTVADVRRFQAAAALKVDGDVGPLTRAAMHRALLALATPAPSEPSLASLHAAVVDLGSRMAAMEAAVAGQRVRIAALEAS